MTLIVFAATAALAAAAVFARRALLAVTGWVLTVATVMFAFYMLALRITTGEVRPVYWALLASMFLAGGAALAAADAPARPARVRRPSPARSMQLENVRIVDRDDEIVDAEIIEV